MADVGSLSLATNLLATDSPNSGTFGQLVALVGVTATVFPVVATAATLATQNPAFLCISFVPPVALLALFATEAAFPRGNVAA